MLTQPATEEMLEQWKEIFQTFRPKLSPNRRTGEEVAAYLCQEYVVKELLEEQYWDAIAANVWNNACFSEKLPQGAKPKARVFCIQNEGKGARLYREQDAEFLGMRIIAGIEIVTGYLYIEGSSALHDELFYYRGLDERDLENCFLVAQYVESARRFGTL